MMNLAAASVWRVALAIALAIALAAFAAGCGGGSPDGSSGEVADSPPPTGEAAPKAAIAGRQTVLFVGTSLTAGLGLEPDSAYPQLLQRKIDAEGLPFEAVNSGVSGETSSGLLRRLDWVLRSDADVIVIETGANDGLRGIPTQTVRENVDAILARIRTARPESRVLLVQMEALPNFGARYARDFHELYPALAKKHGVTLLPFLLDGVAGVASLNQGDGIHPNMEGERRVAENVWKGLRPVLAELASGRER